MTLEKIHQLFLQSSGICTDTRKLTSGQLFFALKGENFDGNSYAKKALENGASYAIIDTATYATNDHYILVANVLQTLQDLSNFHRRYLKTPIIALTGSNGKTTTKELIKTVLATTYKVTATQGNLNNHIGVPLTLLSMTKETEIGVVEMGANHPGEIDFLCNIALPDYGYITNIGKAHLEGFKSLEGVLKAKTELYRHLQQHDKLAFINADDTALTTAAQKGNTYSFAQDTSADLQIKFQAADPMVRIATSNQTITSQLIGSYNATNIAAAITIGSYFKVSLDRISTAIGAYTPKNNRSQLLQHDNQLIILDAYNANPTSMTAALNNLSQLPQKPKIAFLGDMFELGKSAAIEHEKIAALACTSTIEKIYVLGENFYGTTLDNPKLHKYKSVEALQEAWKTTTSIAEEGVFLVKGSRGMQMERILPLIQQHPE